MQIEMTSKQEPHLKDYCLVVDVRGEQTSFELKEGASLLVGSGDACAIKLSSDDAQHLHCMFRLTNREVWVQDWNTHGRTLVNGIPSDVSTQLMQGDEVQVGSVLITARFPGMNGNYQIEAHENEAEIPSPLQAVDLELSNETLVNLVANDSTHTERAKHEESLTTVSESVAKVDKAVGEECESPNPFVNSESKFESDPIATELEILRAEVEYLQAELEEKESQLAKTSSEKDDQDIDNKDTERLVVRLEELLAELQKSDQQIEELESLLRVSDEANEAEKEERRQLELWLNEIESQLLAREAESLAESEVIRAQLEDERKLRTELESRLTSGTSDNADSSTAGNQSLRSLQIRNAELERQLKESQQQLDSQATERDQVQKQSNSAMQQRIHELEANLANERAVIARQNEQFTRFKQDMEKKLEEVRRNSENDSRVDAMREHLRELHIEEQIERRERYEQSLSGRIAKLLQRLDRH